MLTVDLAEKLILLGMAVVVGIVGKIIWDWLKEGHDNKEEKEEKPRLCHCMEHEHQVSRLDAIERCNTMIKKDHASLTASFKSHARQVNKSLDQGQANFIAIREDIGTLS